MLTAFSAVCVVWAFLTGDYSVAVALASTTAASLGAMTAAARWRLWKGIALGLIGLADTLADHVDVVDAASLRDEEDG